jgi:hypothetical protein
VFSCPIRAVPEAGQREDRPLAAGQGAGPVPGAKLAAVLRQQPGHEHRQLERDVKDDPIGQHAEPPDGEGLLARPLVPGAPRCLEDLLSQYVRTSARMGATS